VSATAPGKQWRGTTPTSIRRRDEAIRDRRPRVRRPQTGHVRSRRNTRRQQVPVHVGLGASTAVEWRMGIMNAIHRLVGMGADQLLPWLIGREDDSTDRSRP
jgi:hypothetical protein